MCGIAAILKLPGLELPLETVRCLADPVSHRGPDGSGFVGLGTGSVTRDPSSARWTVAMAHHRLSIIDLSDAAGQPMSYADRYWLVFGGEVYNYLELRGELEKLGHTFRTQGDSEVILASFAEWGTQCFARFRGMWGLTIYDSARNEVTVSRDRIGIKPLYLWRSSGTVVVCSEIKQLLRVPGFRARASSPAISEYVQRGYEAVSSSFFKEVVPLPPGTFLQISLNALSDRAPVSFWSPDLVRVSVRDPREAAQLFAAKLVESVRIHLRSDVGVGFALSGGLDSSSITSRAARTLVEQGEPIRTFTARFSGHPTDETQYAEAVNAQLNAISHFVTPSPSEFLNDLDDFVWHHDEPVGSFSVYAGYCLARLIQQSGVRVALSGQGGDEILSGYWQLYFLYLRELASRGRLLELGSHLLGAMTRDGNWTLIEQIPVMFHRYHARRSGDDLRHLKEEGRSLSGEILPRALALRGQQRRIGEIRDLFLPRLMKWEDRNSMAFSVEGRYPFLDHELIELCLSFSPRVLYRRGWTKWPLRLSHEGILPREILWRRDKLGFEVPQDQWLCGPLRPSIEKWLATERPLWEWLDRSTVRRLAETTWSLAGRREEPGQALFRCFILDRWLDVFEVEGSSALAEEERESITAGVAFAGGRR